jgi:hypothetical protein
VLSNSNLADLESLVVVGDQVASSPILNQSSSKVSIWSSKNNSSVNIRVLVHHTLESALSFLGSPKPNSPARFRGQSGYNLAFHTNGLSSDACCLIIFICVLLSELPHVMDQVLLQCILTP